MILIKMIKPATPIKRAIGARILIETVALPVKVAKYRKAFNGAVNIENGEGWCGGVE